MERPLVYLDVCCLNRPFDDQRQARIRLEAEAVRAVLAAVADGDVRWLGGEVLDAEIARNPDAERRRQVQALAALAPERVTLVEVDRQRARGLVEAQLGTFDALHLAGAEARRADVLLTTDDRFVRRAARVDPASPVRVLNPVTWVTEAAFR